MPQVPKQRPSAADVAGELCDYIAQDDGAAIHRLLSNKSEGVSRSNDRGWLPLQVAALCNAHHAAKVLLTFGADVSAKSGYLAPTALHLAAWHGHIEVAEVLIDHGADLEATNAAGEIPLEKAQQRGKRKCADLLEQRSAKQGRQANNLGGTFMCQECKVRSSNGRLGKNKHEGLWFCDSCWQKWEAPSQLPSGSRLVDGLPVMTRAAFQKRVQEGAKWLIIDGTIIDVEPLTQKGDTLHKGGGDVLSRSVGDDLTGYFIYYHANTPRVDSLHKPGISHMEHVREKVVKNAVGILDTHVHMPPLTDPHHRFWVESDEKKPYYEHSQTSLAAQGLDAKSHLANLLENIPAGSPASRAFWAVVGCLVGDAAAQPTHWNYKHSYFQEDLRKRNRFENPEFLRPSLNTYYHLPMGCQSCYGDQALEVLRSLEDCGGLAPHDVAERFAKRFSETGDYGPLPQDGLYNGNKQEVRELPIKGPWRHISLAGFLKNTYHGKQFPHTGTSDAQADCFVRIVPVAAFYAGKPDMLDRVEEAVRVTQDNPPAIAVGKAVARILEAIILHGADGLQAVNTAIEEFDQKRSDLEGFFGRVAGTMKSVLDLRHCSLYEAVLNIGEGGYSTSAVS